MQVIAAKTFNSKLLGLVRQGMGPITVDDQYGKALIRNGLARVHVPRDMEEQREAPDNRAERRAPRTPEDLPRPPPADPRRHGQASGSAEGSQGRRQGAGSGRRSSSRRAAPALQPRTSSTAEDEHG